jgi:hypothetical protein
MTSPQRIQRRRTKGWRMPDNTVYVGRGTRWGNPYIVGQGPIDQCLKDQQLVAVKAFQAALDRGLTHGPKSRPMPTKAEIVQQLAGKNLACWCPTTEACHADILLTIANSVLVQA